VWCQQQAVCLHVLVGQHAGEFPHAQRQGQAACVQQQAVKAGLQVMALACQFVVQGVASQARQQRCLGR
jgi:hypothetical protein